MNGVSREQELYKINEENFARRFAAKKMGLQEDPRGKKLPDDLWQQCISQAQRALAFEVTERSFGYNNTTVQGTCPQDATVKEVEDRFYHEYFGGRGAWVKDGRFGCTIHND
ncbi:hypothetical protein NKH61_05390 [Mesorhizobium sp. M1005]|uniref:hypothetical protein n=1 Tax=unclassified Mesorhizobium TaxID=325217 RepID=UPI0033394BF4